MTAYDLVVIAGDVDGMRRSLVQVAHDHGIDIAVQVNGLERRAKRLVVMDVDSTLITDEVIELLADEAGCRRQVAMITERAMAGEIRLRDVAAGAGPAARRAGRVGHRTRPGRIRLTPGARTFVAYVEAAGRSAWRSSAADSRPFTDWLKAELALDYAFANTLEIIDGRLTGEVLGAVVDRAAQGGVARRDRRCARGSALPDGGRRRRRERPRHARLRPGLGIAFNAKPVVRAQADTTVSVPYLDAILFMLGIRGIDVLRAEGLEEVKVS